MFQLETFTLCNMEELLCLPEPRSFRNLRHLRNLYVTTLCRLMHMLDLFATPRTHFSE